MGGGIAAVVGVGIHDTHQLGIAAGTVALWGLLLAVRPAPGPPALHTGARNALEAAGSTFAIAAVAAVVGLLPMDNLLLTFVIVLIAGLTAVAISVFEQLRRTRVRAVIVGDPTAVSAVERIWRDRRGVDLIGSYAPTKKQQQDPGLHEHFTAFVRSHGVDIVIVVPGPAYSAVDLQSLCWDLEQTDATVVVADALDLLAPHRLVAGALGGVPVVAVTPTRWSSLYLAIKGTVDRVGAGLLLVLFAPVLGVLALLIKLDSRGPAVFKQRRVGQGGRPFTMYKLRTMHTGPAEAPSIAPLHRTAGNEVLFKMQDDPRVTRFGRVLRGLSLDELPQLLNVLRGEMSLIGPRPALYEEAAKYDSRAWRRTAVKPGITGLWQVSGRSDLSWEESISLDLDYVDNWRPSADVAIAVRTLGAVIRKKGAY